MQFTNSHRSTSVAASQALLRPLVKPLKRLGQPVLSMFRVEYRKRQVQQYQQGSDSWWYSIDPTTGNTVYASSKAELIDLLGQTDRRLQNLAGKNAHPEASPQKGKW